MTPDKELSKQAKSQRTGLSKQSPSGLLAASGQTDGERMDRLAREQKARQVEGTESRGRVYREQVEGA
jgi:hypothetical protein